MKLFRDCVASISGQAATKAIEQRPAQGTHATAIKMMNVHEYSVYMTELPFLRITLYSNN
jgi:hypothetical protein